MKGYTLDVSESEFHLKSLFSVFGSMNGKKSNVQLSCTFSRRLFFVGIFLHLYISLPLYLANSFLTWYCIHAIILVISACFPVKVEVWKVLLLVEHEHKRTLWTNLPPLLKRKEGSGFFFPLGVLNVFFCRRVARKIHFLRFK